MSYRYLLIALCVVSASLALADAYRVELSCPATVTLPSDSGAVPTVYLRDSSARWAPADFELQEGRLVIPLDPAKLGGGHAMILVDPPRDLNIRDTVAPRLLGLWLDGRALGTEARAYAGVASTAPERLVMVVEDRQNRLDEESLSLSVNGYRVDRVRVIRQGPRRLWIRAYLPRLDYGDHTLAYSIADVSPQRNRVEGAIRFARYDLNNYVLAAHGTTLTPDSYFPSYPSHACLQDGNKDLPGNTLPNDISWASEETATPHWVEIDFGQVREVKELTVYWANYSDRLNTSKTVEVQVPEGEGWRAVYRSPESGETPGQCTTLSFKPVSVRKLRLWQPAGAGGVHRPNLMWLAEIEAR